MLSTECKGQITTCLKYLMHRLRISRPIAANTKFRHAMHHKSNGQMSRRQMTLHTHSAGVQERLACRGGHNADMKACIFLLTYTEHYMSLDSCTISEILVKQRVSENHDFSCSLSLFQIPQLNVTSTVRSNFYCKN